MNYFFFIHIDDYVSEITLPKFQNSGSYDKDMRLKAGRVIDGKWEFYDPECIESNDFWSVTSTVENKNDIFFLCSDQQIKKQKESGSLIRLNDFTDTFPDFRSNLSIRNTSGGFSSYQAEYPFQMTLKKGNLYSSISSLANFKAKKNGVFIRNIFHLPIFNEYSAFIYDDHQKEVVDRFTLTSNSTNFISFEDYDHTSSLFLFCEGFIGVPVFFSESSSGNISLEHTHPPHENIQGELRHKIVSRLKNDLYKKITSANL